MSILDHEYIISWVYYIMSILYHEYTISTIALQCCMHCTCKHITQWKLWRSYLSYTLYTIHLITCQLCGLIKRKLSLPTSHVVTLR